MKDREYDAYYLLDDPDDQIEKFFFDIMRSQIPVLSLDELFAVKETISDSATAELEKDMSQFGYEVSRVLITSIVPDEKVQAAMNDINAAQREAQAAISRGESSKILRVKDAEAEAEAAKLRGIGIANQRIEICKGFQESIKQIKTAASGASDDAILNLISLTQYMEMMEKIGTRSNSNLIMVPHSPGTVGDLRQQLTEAMLIGSKTK